MKTEDRRQLVTRNLKEVVTEEELEDVLERDSPRCYVGYETSGPVHLGHWMSIRKLLDLQEAGFDPVVLWADLHTLLNRKGEEDWIRDMTDYWQATFEALGLEAEYTRGREFQESDEYFHDLLELSQKVTLNRGKRSMGDVASGDTTYISHLVYPLMQALDIVHLDLDVAVAGIDQRKIHMTAREHLPKLGYDKPTCLHWPLLSSLGGSDEKMSSSKKDTMFPLHADPSRIQDTIMDAYCPAEEVEDNPVLEIAQYFVLGSGEDLQVEREEEHGGDAVFESFEEVSKAFSSGYLHPLDLKEAVADSVIERLEPVRRRFEEDPELLEPLEAEGHELPDYLD